MTRLAVILALAALLTASANAACPPQATGNTPDAIKANSQRLLCLQQEIATEAERRKLQFDFDALETRQQRFELQQRLNAIAVPPPVWFNPVPAMP